MSGGDPRGRQDAEARPGRTVRIGITGPIGCGKSTVAAWLADLGAVVIDADVVAREVTAPGTPAAASITEEFGPGIVRAGGSLDRAALGRIVFADPEALARLEAIVHPAVRPVILERMEAAAADGAPAVVVEAIKLVEGGLAALCDEVWLVTCDAGEQLARLLARGTPDADAHARIAAQTDIAARLAPAAARIIDTTGSAAATRVRVQAAWLAALEGRAG